MKNILQKLMLAAALTCALSMVGYAQSSKPPCSTCPETVPIINETPPPAPPIDPPTCPMDDHSGWTYEQWLFWIFGVNYS